MATSKSTGLSHANAERLNGLIVACNDDARAQTAAARIVGGARGARLDETTARRVSFARELTDLLRSFGRRADEGGSTFEAVRAAVHSVNALVIGENPGDAYSSCARIAARTDRLYQRAALGSLPLRVEEVVTRHQAEVANDCAELRRLSMGA